MNYKNSQKQLLRIRITSVICPLMSEFSAYEKMPTSMSKMRLSAKDLIKAEKLKWVVTEKVHGANFSFIYENGRLRFAKRRGYLDWSDNFFGFQLVVMKIEQNVTRLFEDLSAKVAGKQFILYGELFGGLYPDTGIEAIEGLHAIQTGVFYSPDVHFCAFDIAVQSEGRIKEYIDYENAVSYFKMFDILHAKPLFLGPLNKALDFNTRFDSTIPRQLHLPDLKDNIAEGVVIKPYKHQGSFGSSQTRPVLKMKNFEFDEEKKFHEAHPWNFYAPADITCLSEDTATVVAELKRFVTPNRLQSAVSKVGALDIDDTQRMHEIKQEFLSDVIDEFSCDAVRASALETLSEEQLRWTRERISSVIHKVMLDQKM